MAEYLNVYNLSAGKHEIPIPKTVLGVYANNPISIDWNFNGTVGTIVSSVANWEPTVPFKPNYTSSLIITTTADTQVSLRVSD